MLFVDIYSYIRVDERQKRFVRGGRGYESTTRRVGFAASWRRGQ